MVSSSEGLPSSKSSLKRQEQKKVARDHFDAPPIDAEGDDPFYGSSFFRERHQTFFQMDGFDYDAIASEDFGAIWA